MLYRLASAMMLSERDRPTPSPPPRVTFVEEQRQMSREFARRNRGKLWYKTDSPEHYVRVSCLTATAMPKGFLVLNSPQTPRSWGWGWKNRWVFWHLRGRNASCVKRLWANRTINDKDELSMFKPWCNLPLIQLYGTQIEPTSSRWHHKSWYITILKLKKKKKTKK